MIVRLNLETRAFHAAADGGWRSLLVPEVTVGAYIQQLVHAYAFEGPIEAALAYTPHLELVIDVHERYRAGYIAQDLIALGLRPGEVARLPQQIIAPFASPLEALGWMYVVERMNPLLEEVRRYLAVRLPQTQHARVYLGSCDGHISARWQAFGHALDRAVRSPRMIDEVLHAARAGFRTWIETLSTASGSRRLA